MLFCIFPCFLSPARLQGRSFVKIPQIPVQKCGILQDFVLYWIKNQHSRAAPGTKGVTHEKHHRGKTRGHPQQRQPDAAGGHRRTFAGFMDLLACPQAERLLHRHSGMHVGTDIFDYAAYIWLHINSAYKISWIILILLFPIFGLTIYLLFGRSGAVSVMRRRFGENMTMLRRYHAPILQQRRALPYPDRITAPRPLFAGPRGLPPPMTTPM